MDRLSDTFDHIMKKIYMERLVSVVKKMNNSITYEKLVIKARRSNTSVLGLVR